MLVSRFFVLLSSILMTVHAYWLNDIQHQGLAPYAQGGYKVFRNVKDYGARGDGVTDDTEAINRAFEEQGRCGKGCPATTKTPAIVYFPGGTYLITGSLRPAYQTMMFGDPQNVPTIKAAAGFRDGFVIDANPYYGQYLNWGATNTFMRQIRNFVIDSTAVDPARNRFILLHWPTAQATSLQNMVFNMPNTGNVRHLGIYIEEGSGGFMTDLTFNGGFVGAEFGNQQFTTRNMKFNNCKTAINQIWNWGWTYIGLEINNCGVGIDTSTGGSSNQGVGSITLIDSTISNTPVGIDSAKTATSSPATGGSMVLENVQLNNVPVAIRNPQGTVLNGGTTTIAAWAWGNSYTPNGPNKIQGNITPNSRPSGLLRGNRYYTESKPQYNNFATGDFVSARSQGARGDGNADDTAALQNALNTAAAQNKVLFIDYGVYKVSNTITVPANSRIVGEAYPIIMSYGSNFDNQASPRVVVKIGASNGQAGRVEFSDVIVSTQGPQSGAILIEYNLAASASNPSGIWDVHTRIGGFTGSNLQVAQCPKRVGNTNIPTNCIASYMAMRVTSGSSGLYMENNWLWSADHDFDSTDNTQIDIYSGRGLLVESTAGNIWLMGTGSEHHVIYQYQFQNTQNIFTSQMQTESPYFQPTPAAPAPFQLNSAIGDPTFNGLRSAYGLRIVNSRNIYNYGTGLYSFFDTWSVNCNLFANGSNCQSSIAHIEGSSNINMYNLQTIGTVNMITLNGQNKASYKDNQGNFAASLAVFRG